MELRAAFMASVYMFSEYMYGLMNLDQIPKIKLESMVMHCMVKELYVGSYLCVESVYLQSLLSPLKV